GVIVTVRSGPVPTKKIFASGTSPGLDEWPVRVKPLGSVSTSPIENGMGAVGVSWLIVWSAMLEIVGGSFTALTVSRKLVLPVPPSSSVTWIVMVVVPLWLLTGQMVIVRLESVPLVTICPSGTSAGFEELQVTTR